MKYIPNYHECYVCGDANKNGLQYRFWVENNNVTTKIQGRRELIGHGAIHGGIIAALLDEAMGLSATIKKNRLCVTAEFTVRYLKPLDIDGIYIVRGNLLADKIILCETYGEIVDEDNNILIRASGKYVPLSKEQSKKIHPDVFE